MSSESSNEEDLPGEGRAERAEFYAFVNGDVCNRTFLVLVYLLILLLDNSPLFNIYIYNFGLFTNTIIK